MSLPPSGSPALRVLILDDSEGILEALLQVRPGLAIQSVGRQGAERAARDNPFDAALIDMTREADAMEAYSRARSRLPGIPMVVLVRNEDPELAEELLVAGAQACLALHGLDGRSLELWLRQAALASRAESRRSRALFDSAPIGILLAVGRRVAMANPAALEILGCDEEGLARVAVPDLFPAGYRPLLEKSLDAAEPVSEARFQAPIQRPAGGESPCQVYLKGALLNGAPAVALYLAAVPGGETPLGESSRGEAPGNGAQARKMEALGRLAGGMAHDFNNMLTAINGYSEHLLPMVGDEGPVAHGLRSIHKAGEAAAAMTRSLMSFSRRDSEELRPVAVDAALDELLPMIREVAGNSVVVSFRPGAGDAHVRLEPGQLEQMILILCANAREAMPRGGEMVLATGAVPAGEAHAYTHLACDEGAQVLISVEDSGKGMSPETVERLFEPFFTTKADARGSGLGLATVYGIVSQARGGLTVASRAGLGSEFRVYLPRCVDVPAAERPAQARAPQAASEAAPQGAARGGRETVLVIEDEPNLREMVRTVLERYGFAVLEAFSGAEALELVEQPGIEVDMAISDVMLRGMSGHELAESLRLRRPGIPVVFMSGHSLDTLSDRGIMVPPEAFLEKPFKPSQLALKVRETLDRKRAHS